MQAPPFLSSYIPADQTEPWVTLTYAQSLDARIAGRDKRQIRLSGEESMVMTHWMRSMHDAIMVGVGTAINDDPRLNVRLLPDSEHHKTPQPIILDPNLRLPTNARMLTILRDPAIKWKKAPWLVCRDTEADDNFAQRRDALVKAGARVIPVPMTGGRLQLPALPALLKDLGIRSLMVEGGAEIIQQFLHAEKVIEIGSPATVADSALESGTGQSRRRRPLADLLVVTVAPVLVPGGYSVLPSSSETQSLPTTTQMASYEHCHTEIMGRDAVMVLRSVVAPDPASGRS